MKRILAVIVIFVLAAPVLAQNVLTPELIVSIRWITSADLAPDGKQIAFQATRPRTETEKPGRGISGLWLIPSAGGEPKALPGSVEGDQAPQWSPDGKQIAFLSSREGAKAQVYVVSVAGGDPVQLTSGANPVLAFKWAPDGKHIAYTMTDPKTAEELEAEKQGKDWIIADRNYKHTRVYTVEIGTRHTTRVTRSDMTVHDFDWSPDGKSLIVAAAPTPSVDDSFMGKRLYTVSSNGGELALLTKTEGKLDAPRWSPDGKWIVWLGATVEKDPYAGSVFIVSSKGGDPQNLTAGYNGTADWLTWMPGKPSTLVFGAIERQSTKLYSIPVSTKRWQLLLEQPVNYVSTPVFSSDGGTFTLVANAVAHPNEVYVGKTGKKSVERLTNYNPQLAGLALGAVEEISWTSTDGLMIEGVLVKPINYQPGRVYPVVMQPHGGPESADRKGWLGSVGRWGQMLAGQGYLVLYPNYRGSIGRGPEYAMADHRDLMGKEFEDMVAGVDYLIKEGMADPRRVGIGGGSYGGLSTAWATTYGSEKFQAAVMWMGISNWISMTGTSDIFYENSTVHWNLMMYEGNNYETYWRQSPLAHIDKAKTPTLIIHGAADPRVPPSQSQEMYTALKWKGVPVEFVLYPREGHGVSERAHQLDFLTRIREWFDKYLKATVTP